MPDLMFRKAANDDAGAIATVGVALWEELGPQSGLPGPMTAEGVRSRMAEWGERGGIFVCDEGGICGFAIVQADVNHPDHAVMGVWLVPEARGKGLGRDLAVMGTEFATGAGYKSLRGIIPEGNEPALSFFGDFASMAQIVGQGMEYELPL
jgi:ribosomal protein S18 acetylase RimI-like enzyme